MGGFRCFIHPFLSLLRPQCFDGVGGRGAEGGGCAMGGAETEEEKDSILL